MNHYRYMSTSAQFFTLHGNVPDPKQPPGGGWELKGQCAIALTPGSFMLIWSWRQLSFTTPSEKEGGGNG